MDHQDQQDRSVNLEIQANRDSSDKSACPARSAHKDHSAHREIKDRPVKMEKGDLVEMLVNKDKQENRDRQEVWVCQVCRVLTVSRELKEKPDLEETLERRANLERGVTPERRESKEPSA